MALSIGFVDRGPHEVVLTSTVSRRSVRRRRGSRTSCWRGPLSPPRRPRPSAGRRLRRRRRPPTRRRSSDDVCLAHRDEVLELLATRDTQTNECGRSAVIVAAFAWVAGRLGEPLALLDVGASAGLNLLCDQYRIDYGAAGVTGPLDSSVRIECRVLGGSPPIAARAPRARRHASGWTATPVDLHDPDATRWLLACVWPDTGRDSNAPRPRSRWPARRGTLRSSRAMRSRTSGRCSTGSPVTPRRVSRPPGCSRTSHHNSGRRSSTNWRDFAVRRPLAWISAEGPGVVDCIDVGEPPRHDPTTPSALGAVLYDRDGYEATMLGWVHPHGRWIDWHA